MWCMLIGQGVENNKYLLDTTQIIPNWNYAGLCLLVTACHINAGFIPLAWRAELSWECLFQGGRVYKIDLQENDDFKAIW